jgi:short-subunit dehydrogenase
MATKRDTALITGASSGIGEALAWLFAENNYDLVLVARNAAKLESLADVLAADHGIKVSVRPADLSKHGAAGKLCKALEREGQRVDVLVNNAGVLQHGAFTEMAPTDQQGMIQLNIAGFTDLLSHLLPGMVKRGSGKVLNVASVAAFQPIPYLATYAATKAYVLSLTEALTEELRDSGVTITALCPGVTDTNMIAKAEAQGDGLNLPGVLVGDVETVATEGYDALMKGTTIVIPGALNQATAMTTRAMPKWLVRRLMGLATRSAF